MGTEGRHLDVDTTEGHRLAACYHSSPAIFLINTEVHLPRGGTAQSVLGFPVSIIDQTNKQGSQTCAQSSLNGQLLH